MCVPATCLVSPGGALSEEGMSGSMNGGWVDRRWVGGLVGEWVGGLGVWVGDWVMGKDGYIIGLYYVL